jgi:hypothetical protein
MLSQEQIETYQTQGFVQCRGWLPDDSVRECLGQLEWLFRDQAQKAGVVDADTADFESVVYQIMKPNTDERKFVYELARYTPAIRALQVAPFVYEAVRSLGLEFPITFQIPSIRFDMPKAGEDRYLTPQHQDVRSIRSARCITVWIPFTHSDAQNGTIAVYPGSFRSGLRHHRVTDNGQMEVVEREPAARRVVVDTAPGDVLFMNSFCVHESYREGLSGHIKVNAQFMYNDAAALNRGDAYEDLARTVPMYGDIHKY